MKRVTGIGGIFFKAKDAPTLQAWYKLPSIGPTRMASRLRAQQPGASIRKKVIILLRALLPSWSTIEWKTFTL